MTKKWGEEQIFSPFGFTVLASCMLYSWFPYLFTSPTPHTHTHTHSRNFTNPPYFPSSALKLIHTIYTAAVDSIK